MTSKLTRRAFLVGLGVLLSKLGLDKSGARKFARLGAISPAEIVITSPKAPLEGPNAGPIALPLQEDAGDVALKVWLGELRVPRLDNYGISAAALRERMEELQEEGFSYHPKCLSESVSINHEQPVYIRDESAEWHHIGFMLGSDTMIVGPMGQVRILDELKVELTNGLICIPAEPVGIGDFVGLTADGKVAKMR